MARGTSFHSHAALLPHKYRWHQRTCGPFVVRRGTFAIKSELKELAHNSSLMSELKTLTKFDVKKFFELSSLTKT